MNKNILVTGGTGFIGRHVVKLLVEKKFQVTVLTRNKKFLIENINDNIIYINQDLNSLNSERVDYINNNYGPFDGIVYLAANIPTINQKKENYLNAMNSTLKPLVNFTQLTADSMNINKFVFISTIDVVGIPQSDNYGEDVFINPITPYGLAKYCCELYISKILNSKNISFDILRFSQVFGPNEPKVRVIPIILDSLINGKIFKKYTDGKELRRFLYVKDAAKSIYNSLISKDTGTYNVAGEDIVSINDVITKAENIFNKKILLEVVSENSGIYNVPSISKIVSERNFKPEYSFIDGLQEILRMEKNDR